MSTTTIDVAALRAAIRANLARARADRSYALGVFLALAGVAATVQMLGTGFARMAYPFALEWTEGGVVDHVRVVLSGEPLYREPSFAWTPFVHPPFYYWVCAVFMKAFGVSFFWARLVSALSMIGCLGWIVAFVRKESGGWLGAVIAAGLFAITFERTGFSLDLARVDTLSFALFLGGAYLTRFGKTPVAAAISGLLLFLSFFTKQTTLVLAVPVLVAGIGLDRRRGLITAGVAAGLGIGAMQWMDLSSHGWFRYYVFVVASRQLPAWHEWHALFLHAFSGPLAVALALSVLALGVVVRERWAIVFYAGLLAVAWVVSLMAVVAVLAGVAIQWALAQDGSSRVAARLRGVAIGILFLQFVVLAYDQRAAVPRRRDERSGRAAVERWRKLREQGAVLSFGFGYYGMLAGDPEVHAHTLALSDVFATRDRARTDPLLDDVVRRLRAHRYRTIVYDASLRSLPPAIEQTIRDTYRPRGQLFEVGVEDDRTWPRSGFACRPNELLVAP